MALAKSLDDLIRLLEKFPGIGEKSARRMVLFLLQQPKSFSEALVEAIHKCSFSLFHAVFAATLPTKILALFAMIPLGTGLPYVS